MALVVIAGYNASGLRVHPDVDRPLLALRVARPAGVLVEQVLQPLAELRQRVRPQPEAEPGALQPLLPRRSELLQERGEDDVGPDSRPGAVHQPALAGRPVGHLAGTAGP